MRIRFACASGVLTRPAQEASCSWCGFRAGLGQLDYADVDGEETVACGVCFAARHARDADPQLFRLAWLPEISQPDLAHLTRVMAVVAMRGRRFPSSRPDHRAQFPTPQDGEIAAAKNNIATIMQGLLSRVRCLEPLEEMLAANGGSLHALDKDQERRLLPGLRLLPVAFDSADIEGWVNDESSLNGYGTGTLHEQNWFASDLGSVSLPDATQLSQNDEHDNEPGDTHPMTLKLVAARMASSLARANQIDQAALAVQDGDAA